MDLFRRYLPIYVFHQEETNFPIDFKDYLTQSSLIKNGKSRYTNVSCLCEGCPFIISKNNPIRKTITGEVILEKGNLTYETPPIPNIDNGKDCYLEYSGNLTNSLNPEVPVYCSKKETDTYLDLYYHLLYNYQPSYQISFCNNPLYLGGDHQSDIETIKYRILKKDNKIQHISYYQHGNEVEYSLDNLEKVNHQIIVYIAKYSHASYPKEGRYTRILGLANDYCSNLRDGIKWKPKVVVDMNSIPDNYFMKWFRGNYGNDGVTAFANRL